MCPRVDYIPGVVGSGTGTTSGWGEGEGSGSGRDRGNGFGSGSGGSPGIPGIGLGAREVSISLEQMELCLGRMAVKRESDFRAQ